MDTDKNKPEEIHKFSLDKPLVFLKENISILAYLIATLVLMAGFRFILNINSHHQCDDLTTVCEGQAPEVWHF